MIKVLVVDDDKLVRKGLISAMPWQDFGMEVVGEANNGAKALEFLESHAVDLLLTDLDMPVMTGMELMRTARERFPYLHIGVLTLYQDFEYIQEALRLGAIDYIAKVQLEKERFEEVLGRIADRIHKQTMLASPDPFQSADFQMADDQGYVVMPTHGEADAAWVKELRLSEGTGVKEADCNVFFCHSPAGMESSLLQELTAAAAGRSEWMLLLLSGLRGHTWKDIQHRLREFREKELFYAYHPDNKAHSLSFRPEGEAQPHEFSEEQLDRLKASWLSLEWIRNDELYDCLLRELKGLRLPAAMLTGVLYYFANEWSRLFAQTSMGNIHLPESLHSWYHVEQWLDEVHRLIKGFAVKSQYSQEIIGCMMRAVQMIEAEMNGPLTAAETAKRLNLSRSYFCQCFKDIIGRTFNEHMRQIRMEKAKELLLSTNKTISWVAENTGYTDEKYFSRMFREQTGMLPSEFRLMSGRGGTMSDES